MAAGFAVGLSHLSRCHVSRLYVFWQLTLVTAVTLMPQASVTAESLLQSGIDNCCHVCHAVTHYQFCHWAYCCLYLHLKWTNPGRKTAFFALYAVQNAPIMILPYDSIGSGSELFLNCAYHRKRRRAFRPAPMLLLTFTAYFFLFFTASAAPAVTAHTARSPKPAETPVCGLPSSTALSTL